MNHWEQKIEHLAARAQAEQTPRVDVAYRVLHSLLARQNQSLTMPERLWLWLAAVSTALAVPAGVIAFIVYTNSDPLTEIAEAISWAIQ